MAKLTVEVTEKGISQTDRKLKGLTSTGKTASNQFSILGKNALASAASITTVAASFGALSIAISKGVSNLSDYEVNLKRTEAILTATGNAAGFTAEQLQKQAEALALNTLTGVENVQKAQAALLTFNRVSGDVFTEAIELSQDLAEAGFGSIESNAVQLGKALQDPITGISALTRVGVTFNDTQKETIRLAQQSGDTLAAQTIIIQALTEQVGGAGASVAEGSLAGKIDTAGQLWDDFTMNLAESTGAFAAAKSGVDLVIGALNTLNEALEGPSLGEQLQSAENSYRIINQQIDDQIAKVEELRQKQEQGFGYLTGDYDLRLQINNAEANLAKLEEERVRRAETLASLQAQQSEQIQAEEEAKAQGIARQAELEDQARADRAAKEAAAIAEQQQREQDAIDLRVQALQQRYQSEFDLLTQQIALVDQSTLNEAEKLEIIDNLYDEYYEKRIEAAEAAAEAEKAASDAARRADEEDLRRRSQALGDFTGDLRTALGEQNALYKATATVNATIKTYEAANAAYAALAGIPIVGPALGAAAAGAAVAAGLANVAAINSARAQGGQVNAGDNVLVGERGPEIVSMGSSGRVIPNNQLTGAQSSGVTVNVYNETGANVEAVENETGGTDIYIRRDEFPDLLAAEGGNPDSNFNQAQDRVYTRQRA